MNVDGPWPGDTCSLVDAFRSGDRSPVEELEATLAAVEASSLNAFSFVGEAEARAAASSADPSLPLGGVPVAVKEVTNVAGWPSTDASLVLKDRVAPEDAIMVARLREAGAVVFGLTTSSEFGGVNYTRTKLNGTTVNPWSAERTPGGSSGGSAAAVSGGLCTIATAGDGGGSIRIPAAFTGLPGLKNTYGRIPKGPRAALGSLTSVTGCLSRSVRDIARWLDVCNGHDGRDPLSLPRVDGWESGLLSRDVSGLRTAVLLDFAGAIVDPEVAYTVETAAASLISSCGLTRVPASIDMPSMGVAWALSGAATIYMDLGDRWPACGPDLTPQIKFLLDVATQRFDLAAQAQIEERRVEVTARMAALFADVDLVITPTCPDVAFAAGGWEFPITVGGETVDVNNNLVLTGAANLYGNPAVSVPVGLVRGMPVGMQVMARHHREDVLLDLAARFERESPWPLVAPGSPA